MDDVDFDIEFAEANENDDVVINDEQNVKNLDLTEPARSHLRYYRYQKGDQPATCRTCGAKVPRPNYGTTGMENHLRRYHRKLQRRL
jgi:hypothetical protein